MFQQTPGPREMYSKFAGKCILCRRPIEAGTLILWSKASGAWHKECPPAQPQQPAEQKPANLPTLPWPTEATREGRMLLAGQVTATVLLPTDEHITLKLTAKNKTSEGWERAQLADAQFVFVKMGERHVATMYPEAAGCAIEWRAKVELSADAADALAVLFSHMAGGLFSDDYEVRSEDRCGYCGDKLTDPVSIERGIGPVCYGRVTGSKHAKVAA